MKIYKYLICFIVVLFSFFLFHLNTNALSTGESFHYCDYSFKNNCSLKIKTTAYAGVSPTIENVTTIDSGGTCDINYVGNAEKKLFKDTAAQMAGYPFDCPNIFYKQSKKTVKVRTTKADGYKKASGTHSLESETTIDNGKDNDDIETAHIKGWTPIVLKNKITSCEQLLSDDFLEIMKYVFLIIKIATPIILIVFTMLDFTKAVADSDEAMKKAVNNFIKRGIIALAIFLLPDVLNFILNVTGIGDGTCGIG